MVKKKKKRGKEKKKRGKEKKKRVKKQIKCNSLVVDTNQING